MATGHINPGFGNPVSRLKRSQSALERVKANEVVKVPIPSVEQRTLDAIRERARRVWSRIDREPTTYNFFHRGSKLDEPTRAKPSSEWRHNPHPKPVFLTNRLHYIPPFHNPDASMGKEVYRVDGTRDLAEDDRARRGQVRDKYIGRPSSSAVNQYLEPWASLKESVGPEAAWGAQAWMKIADDKDQHEVFSAVQDFMEKDLYRGKKDRATPSVAASPRPHTAIPSMHRWMKYAGAGEVSNVRTGIDTMFANNPKQYPSSPLRLGYVAGIQEKMRMSDIAKVKKSRYVHRPVRGEYLIHQEWPPTLPHHRVD